METVQELQPSEKSIGGSRNLDEALNILCHDESSVLNAETRVLMPITNSEPRGRTTAAQREVHKKELD